MKNRTLGFIILGFALAIAALAYYFIAKPVLDAKEALDKIDTTRKILQSSPDPVFQHHASGGPDDPKARPLYDKALTFKEKSEALRNYIQALRKINSEMQAGAEGRKGSANTNLFEQGYAQALRVKIDSFRVYLLDASVDSAAQEKIRTMLNTDEQYSKADRKKVSWEYYNFHHLPKAATDAQLSRVENDIRNAEGEAVNSLFNQISNPDFKFDKLTSPVISPSTITVGSK